ncbi:MAG: tetratricopeptide repeat protein, partial [bacterium]|nr:tetratricopeptide repeat protein [bacterium]
MDHRIDQLRQRLREDPSSRQFFQLGELLRKEGKIEEATGVLSAGLEHFPRYVAAWLSLGRAELNREMFDDAELAFSKALELDPANGAAARMLGETALARGDWLKAHKSFKFASALAPQDEEIEKALVRVEAQLAEAGHEPGYDTQDLIEEVASQYRKTLEVEVEPEPHIVGDEEDPFGETPPQVERPVPQVYMVSDDDPFETGSPGDSGEWDEPDDVFAFDQQSAAVEDSVQPEVAPESEDVFAAEAVSESSHEPTEDFEVRAEPQPEEPE